MSETGVRIFQANVKDAFSRGDMAERVLGILDFVQPDVAVLCEAYDALDTDTETRDNALADLAKAGYHVNHRPQDIDTARPDQHGLVLATRENLTHSVESVRLISRYALRAVMEDASTGRQYRVFGFHADDNSERTRVTDARALVWGAEAKPIDGIDDYSELPTVIATDGNTMDRRRPVARVLRAAKPFTYLLPAAKEYNPSKPPTGLPLWTYRGRRVGSMASGKAYKVYADGGYHDADARSQATMHPLGIPLKVDYIFHNDGFKSEGAEIIRLSPADDPKLFDHDGSLATLRITA